MSAGATRPAQRRSQAGPRPKHVPQRMCVACRDHDAKRELCATGADTPKARRRGRPDRQAERTRRISVPTACVLDSAAWTSTCLNRRSRSELDVEARAKLREYARSHFPPDETKSAYNDAWSSAIPACVVPMTGTTGSYGGVASYEWTGRRPGGGCASGTISQSASGRCGAWRRRPRGERRPTQPSVAHVAARRCQRPVGSSYARLSHVGRRVVRRAGRHGHRHHQGVDDARRHGIHQPAG